ncbi:EAL domain-containing protein (putative c-di-GMP-specific phosphodiesterase class I) [Rhodobacter aestuarii]|uniref:EAL domain, c-di-GMP-specific phosphodiesterase class I (Or its enzymatically inactive variant) n=1 Tax=Rhodobacter aestuarii TaxID=453582 RepID=A0A1N7QJ38_9RHOB|nr:EAL domain-containing protein [Rhodobacter aestuarii]PTV93176.1 EAL domain-containing protein (putative c-di-GMP-specific phosphodiesterase class I) [Rhodobacter aestuarii]SIT22784.1 EAL domain, c-di-GMP-specific phosphodiesterase class I (or its enzymatically inactive variant) [Rhodobacter aestuarii]
MTKFPALPREPIQLSEASPLSYAVSSRDRETIAMVRQAIERRDVLLAFQPIVQTAQPDRPAFYEGLIRVIDETGRVVPSIDFIHTVETSDLGRTLDCLALEMGLAALAENPALRLSVNMSARSIGWPEWMRILTRGLTRDDTAGERLILEITESSAMTMPELVLAFMNEMHLEGISFALDDFGAGYTSFRYLREFHFDILKISGQFISGIARNPDNQVLTHALLSIARHFQMFAVAEEVEAAEDAAWLAQAGMDCMQGYYFGAPTIRPPWHTSEARLAHC